ncbi:MAG: hypothetical protein FJ053_00845 [Cyanobacteria bacterium M_surface_10_m1_298]|nr:hypothetical protein [Cyanobacteria bacterium M_surface_10_m1_298]
MAFHALDSLSPAAVQGLAQACSALVSATPSAREALQLRELFPALVGSPWPGSLPPQLPLGLSDLIRDQRQRQETMQLFTLLAFLEPELETQKVALLKQLAEELEIEPAVMADLEEVCRGHVLKAFGDLYRRTFRELNHDSTLQGYARFILPMLGLGIDQRHQERYAALEFSAPGSLGQSLHHYYEQNGFPYPGSRQGLPYDYVATHDVHHVIGGYATDPDGELQVLAFSMGLFPDHALLIAIPALLQFQMGIADPLAGSVAPKLKDQLQAPAFASALQRGSEVIGPIRDLHWDFWTWIDRPLEDVRQDLNVR